MSRPAEEIARAGMVMRAAERALPSRVLDTLLGQAGAIAGGPAAIYVADIDGSQLIRAVGDRAFPARVPGITGLGPDLPLSLLGEIRRVVRRAIPASEVAPIVSGDRALALLVTLGEQVPALRHLATAAAAVFLESEKYSDTVAAARRTKPISAAAEIQTNLLPPRCARFDMIEIAGTIVPAYDVGGDWFDYAENRDGIWLAVADGIGRGAAAAALATVALGAFRAARRNGGTLEDAAAMMHETVGAILSPSAFVTAIIGRIEGGDMFRWINCGHLPPLLAPAGGGTRSLDAPPQQPLGLFERPRAFEVASQTLEPGDRLLLYTDGVIERRMSGGSELGLTRIRQALGRPECADAVTTVDAIQREVSEASKYDLEDDSTVVVIHRAGGG